MGDETIEIQESDCSAGQDGGHFWRDGGSVRGGAHGGAAGVAGQVLVFDMGSCCKAAYRIHNLLSYGFLCDVLYLFHSIIKV